MLICGGITAAAMALPHPSDFQLVVFRTMLALGAACVAASIPGFITVAEGPIQVSGVVASGLAVFALVFLWNPGSGFGRPPKNVPVDGGPSPPKARVARSVAAPVSPVASPAAPERSVFISYRRADTVADVGRLHAALTTRFGEAAVFKDVSDIVPGQRFATVLADSLQHCVVVILVIGPAWEQVTNEKGIRLADPNDFVRLELMTALGRRVPIIPTLVRRPHLPLEADLPGELHDLLDFQAVPLRDDPDFDGDTARIISAIEFHLANAIAKSGGAAKT
jgi:hypothetical protein